MSHLRFCSVFACLFVVILTGCSSLNTAAVRVPDSAKPTSDMEAGFVFLSVGAARTANFTHQALVFEAKGQTETSWFRFAGWSPDFEDQNARGAVFFARLRPGDYELVDVNFYIYSQYITSTWTAKPKFSIPFTVRRGEAIYLGEFLAYSVFGRNMFGMQVPGGGYFVVSDRFERDSTLLKSKEEAPKDVSIVKAVVDPDSARIPLIRRNANEFKNDSASTTGRPALIVARETR